MYYSTETDGEKNNKIRWRMKYHEESSIVIARFLTKLAFTRSVYLLKTSEKV